MAGNTGRIGESELENGGQVPGTDQPAYSLHKTVTPPVPILIAAPHGGRIYPDNVLNDMRDPAYACIRLEDRLIDEVAISVAQQIGASLLVANAPRALLDLNRAQDDVDWEMISGGNVGDGAHHSQSNRRARSGLGLVPRRLPKLGEIWKKPLQRNDLNDRISKIHQPYHAALSKELQRIRDYWGAALLIDLHSMPPLKKSYSNSGIARFVLGDRFGASSTPALVRCAGRYLEMHDCNYEYNRPYSGGYVLDRHSAPARGLHAIQLEVCRTTYLDTGLTELGPRMAPLAKMLAGMVRELSAATARLADAGDIPKAAE